VSLPSTRLVSVDLGSRVAPSGSYTQSGNVTGTQKVIYGVTPGRYPASVVYLVGQVAPSVAHSPVAGVPRNRRG
jgi:hypothetical protein